MLDRTISLIQFVHQVGLLDIMWQTGAGETRSPESAPLPPRGAPKRIS